MRCKMWKTVYPKQGKWFHIDNLLQVGEIYQYLLENYDRVRIRMIINNGDRMQGVKFQYRSKVEWFKVFARNNLHCGSGKLKIRVKEETP